MIIQSQFNTVEYAIIKCHFFMIPLILKDNISILESKCLG